MDRLTKKFTDGSPYCEEIIDVGIEDINYPTYVGRAVDKLAEYEDLEEQRKLLKLPCAVGDTVYRINKGAEQPIIPLQVMNFKIFNTEWIKGFKMECVDECDGAYVYRERDIGRKVFITIPEAEWALVEIEEEFG